MSKWTLLPSENKHLELLQLLALAVANPKYTASLDFQADRLLRNSLSPLWLECLFYHHPVSDGKSSHQNTIIGSGLTISADGAITVLSKKDSIYISKATYFRKLRQTLISSKYFILGYGSKLSHHSGTDDLDFQDPNHQLKRFYTLFQPNQKITDGLAFLNQLQYRGAKLKRLGAHFILKTLSHLMSTCLKIDSESLLQPDADLSLFFQRLQPSKQMMVLIMIDICRHCYDAFPKSKTPLCVPGVVLMDQPERFCALEDLPIWIEMINNLVPNMQFIVSMGDEATRRFPSGIKKQQLSLSNAGVGQHSKKETRKWKRLPGKPVLLIDVDSTLPNLALMKLSRYYKELGKEVVLAKKNSKLKRVERVFASCIFNSNHSKSNVKRLRNYYGSDIQIGGSGVDLSLRLPGIIENLPADYDLYPELEDRAIGFITRGCPHKCSFCVVPVKEGDPHIVSRLDSLLYKNRKKLILLDDNLLAHEESTAILEQMVMKKIDVNFTQTLDLRYVNKKKAILLRALNCMNTRFSRPNYYFSLNNNKRFSLISKRYSYFNFTHKDNVQFICMYGYNTTLAQDVERFGFIKTLPGAYVFTQRYRPVGNTAAPKSKDDFFNENADALIDQLINIKFSQNMKSMENYYRWVSKKYVLTFGKLHDKLVETIFKYNKRYERGHYIATMAGTRDG